MNICLCVKCVMRVPSVCVLVMCVVYVLRVCHESVVCILYIRDGCYRYSDYCDIYILLHNNFMLNFQYRPSLL